MSVTVTCAATLSVVETLSLGLTDAPNPTITHAVPDTYTTLNAATTPPATVVAEGTLTLSGGTLTVDLTSILGPTVNSQSCPVTFSGKKLNCVKIVSSTSNTSAVYIAPGTSNGYQICGSTNVYALVAGGDEYLALTNASLPTVASTAKTVLITSSTSAAQVNVLLVGG